MDQCHRRQFHIRWAETLSSYCIPIRYRVTKTNVSTKRWVEICHRPSICRRSEKHFHTIQLTSFKRLIPFPSVLIQTEKLHSIRIFHSTSQNILTVPNKRPRLSHAVVFSVPLHIRWVILFCFFVLFVCCFLPVKLVFFFSCKEGKFLVVRA